MSKEIDLWQFIVARLNAGERVVLLVVAESLGSSPGRAGYKMAVAENGDLIGSIGGGVMEVNLVDRARQILSEPPTVAGGLSTEVIEQDHRKNSEHPSGMICSGRQTVILRELRPSELPIVTRIIDEGFWDAGYLLLIGPDMLSAGPNWCGTAEIAPGGDPRVNFERNDDSNFLYSEKLNERPRLYIIGGGHCALALSELMSRLDFRIFIFDDRPGLNTLEKNSFADEIVVTNSYENIAAQIQAADHDEEYVVVMTLGYNTDEIVIRKLVGRSFKYFGVLGSRAKMTTLLRELKKEGYPQDQLDTIRTPIGIQINSHTPEEIAVSIAAEIISVKNS